MHTNYLLHAHDKEKLLCLFYILALQFPAQPVLTICKQKLQANMTKTINIYMSHENKFSSKVLNYMQDMIN